MSPRNITPGLSVSPQLSPEDLKRAAEAGFRTVINNRPDGEEPSQPTSDMMRRHAEALGLGYVHIPVAPGKIGHSEVKAFEDALQAAQGPALAFCRTGTRAASLWALSQVGKQAPEAILQATAAAGYDLATLGPRLWRAQP